MLASFAASAASVSINNPTVLAGSGDVLSINLPATQYTFGSEFVPGEATSVSWDTVLTGASMGLVNFNVSSTLLDWSLSIFDGSSTTVLTSNNADNSVVSSLFTMSSGIVYNLIMTGTSAINSFTVGFAYPPAVSEVPLPAAVWLFGSVLLGGLALRRRSKKENMQAVAAKCFADLKRGLSGPFLFEKLPE
ncbi:VPLPA-CTERM sorting domain-containing protein [Nitrincola sp. A-D6]|uniref:VPLPA-CTERM sorting domain-containing protein n=1 Tax=Nitrincola sp. A-D6 TaxID=1545442 RepID=UPI0005695D30|nr:VPLPA-CTERM sorting domain-containing protein [Nitrincola sp. A-D6]